MTPVSELSQEIKSRMAKAIEYYQSGEFQLAEELCDRILELDGTYSDCFLLKGLMALQTGDAHVAAELIKRALKGEPTNAVYHSNLGNVYQELGKLSRAIDSYSRAVQLQPESGEMHYNLAQALQNAKRSDEAIHHYKKAIELQPVFPDAYNNIGLALMDNDNIEEAVSYFEKAIEMQPDHASAHCNMGKAFTKKEKWDEAIAYLKQAIQLDPHHKEALQNLGMAFGEQELIEEAVEYFQRLIELEPKNATAKHSLAAFRGEATEIAPKEYVIDLFDGCSTTFDNTLVKKLHYRTPALLRQLLDSFCGDHVHFRNVLDLGCGTGLSGLAFRDVSHRLIGIDLSPKMLKEAEKKGVYDLLHAGDIVDFMNETKEKYDLFVSADVLVYIGNLRPVVAALSKCALEGACFLFSTEKCRTRDYLLRTSGRYAHSFTYIESLAETHNFSIERHLSKGIRKDKGTWIIGDLYLLKSLI